MNSGGRDQASNSFGHDATRRSTPRWHIARGRRLAANGVIRKWRSERRNTNSLDIVTLIPQVCLNTAATSATFATNAAAAAAALATLWLVNVDLSHRRRSIGPGPWPAVTALYQSTSWWRVGCRRVGRDRSMGEVGKATGAGARRRRAGAGTATGARARSRCGAGALQTLVAGMAAAGGVAVWGDGGGRWETAQPFEQHQTSFFNVFVVVVVFLLVIRAAVARLMRMRSVLVEGVDEAEGATQRRHHRALADDAAAVAAGALVEVGDRVGGVVGRLLRRDRLQAAVDFGAQRAQHRIGGYFDAVGVLHRVVDVVRQFAQDVRKGGRQQRSRRIGRTASMGPTVGFNRRAAIAFAVGKTGAACRAPVVAITALFFGRQMAGSGLDVVR